MEQMTPQLAGKLSFIQTEPKKVGLHAYVKDYMLSSGMC